MYMKDLKRSSIDPITEESKTYSKYSKWMKVVLRRAQVVGERDLPISALIIDQKGRCIGRGSNKREINKDPLGHAELIALRQAAWIRNDWRFNDCVMIVNLEPCQMCAGAIIQSRIGKIIFIIVCNFLSHLFNFQQIGFKI